MFYETRTPTPPTVSAAFQPLADAFHQGDIFKAIQLEKQLHTDATPLYECAGDLIVRIELLRATGQNRRSYALSRIAGKLFPEDPALQIYRVRVFMGNGRILQGIDFFENHANELLETAPAVWYGEMASIQAEAGFEMKARKFAEQALEANDLDPVVYYLLACTECSLRRWEKAIEWSEKTLELAPRWPKARGMLIYTLLSAGRRTEANHYIAEGRQKRCIDATVELYNIFVESSDWTPAQAVENYQAYLDRWPKCEYNAAINRSYLIAAAENGDSELVERLLEHQTDSIQEQLKEASVDEVKSQLIHLPFVAQKRDQCVPTSIAMIAYAQGIELDPGVLYREMHGRHGTPLWRMREWIVNHGFQFRVIDFNQENVQTMLDLNIPLLGLVEGFMLSHVDVLCGYNSGLGVLYVRDPMSWMTMPFTIDEFVRRHETTSSLFLMVSDVLYQQHQAKIDSLSLCHEGEAVIDLMEACVKGNRVDAEHHFKEIPEGHLSEFTALNVANRIVFTPTQFVDSQKRIVNTESLPLSTRFQALIRMNTSDSKEQVDAIIESDELKLAPGGLKFVRLFQHQNNGNSTEALEICETLLGLGGPSAFIWSTRAGLLQEMGRLKEAEESLENALEIEPGNAQIRQQMLILQGKKNLPSSEIVELRKIALADPDNKSLFWTLAQAELAGADGLKYEQTIREYLKYFPRDPDAWFSLISWFLSQQNLTKMKQVSAEAAELLPPDEAPTLHLDKEPEAAENEDQKEPESVEKITDETTNSELLGRFADGEPEISQTARKVLASRDRRGKLLWYEAASFRAIYLGSVGHKGIETIEPEILQIPEEGVLFQTVNHILGLLTTEFSIQPGVAKAVDDWVGHALPDFRAHSETWFNYVLIKEARGEFEDALKELEALLQKFPGNSSASYRLGVIRANQGRLNEAQELFQSCLDLDPGLPGAMEELGSVSQQLNDEETFAEATIRQVCKFPYRYHSIVDQLFAKHSSEGAEKARKYIDSVADRFSPQHSQLLLAHLAVAEEKHNDAWQILESISLPDDMAEIEEDFFEDYLKIKLQSAILLEDPEKVLSTCDFGLKKWPDSAHLLKIKGNELAEEHPAQARGCFKDAIKTGFGDGQTCYNYLCLVDNPVAAARDCLTYDFEEPEAQDQLVSLFCSVFNQPRFVGEQGDFLVWARKKFASHIGVVEALIDHYQSIGKDKDALGLAVELNEAFPSEPHFHFLRGRALINTNPKAADRFLRKAYQQSQSTQNIFEYARCQHALGNKKKARELHLENMEKQPLHSSSLTNLYLLGEPEDKIWQWVNPILENHATGFDDEYFLVVAVKIAKAVNGTLHPNWLPLAFERLDVMQIRPGYSKEKSELEKAVKAWLGLHPIAGHPLNPKMKWMVNLVWPGTKWVAKEI